MGMQFMRHANKMQIQQLLVQISNVSMIDEGNSACGSGIQLKHNRFNKKYINDLKQKLDVALIIHIF